MMRRRPDPIARGARGPTLFAVLVGALLCSLELAAWHTLGVSTAAAQEPAGSRDPGWVTSWVPESFWDLHVGELALWQILGLVALVLVSYLVGALVAGLGLRVAAKLAKRTVAKWDDDLLRLARGPSRLLLALALALASLPGLRMPADANASVTKILLMALIGTVAWLLVRGVRMVSHTIEARAAKRAETEEQGDLVLRGVRTRVVVLRRVVSILVGVVAAALMLLQFDVVRTVGMSLLASAGIAGVVVGFAAQKSIASLLAGLQLSIAQPVRIGDTIIIENEWGTVEEINLTYVIVKIWDERRLVVPMSRFLEQPFQNWTRGSPELLGTVFFQADHRLPVDAARAELERILADAPKWDGRVEGVVVTDATDRSIQLRALVSAKNASDLWDLRCHVREALVAWLRRFENGAYLPRLRLDERAPRAARERSTPAERAPS